MKLFISKLHYKNINNLDFFEKFSLKVLLLFSFFYNFAVRIRNFLYDFRIIKAYNSGVYTVSLGNITTGGVGKTPVCAEFANYFAAKGKRVAILSRGYGGLLDNKIPNIISNGEQVFYDSDMAGDEPYWLANSCCASSVITCASRVKAAKVAVSELGAEVLLLDDGFQHRKLRRNLNIVLVDAKNKFGNGLVLPAGPLREGLINIKRADKIIVVNKSFDDQEAVCFCAEIEKQYSKKVFLCNLLPDKAYNIINNAPLEKGARVIAFSAIGQPKGFYDFLKKDYELAVTVDFEDHYSYSEESLRDLLNIAQEENVDKLVTTEKDAVKMKNILLKIKPDVSIYALKLKASIDIEEICNA